MTAADQALAALIDDLAARGLLYTTLVIAMGECGRTPPSTALPGAITGHIVIAWSLPEAASAAGPCSEPATS